MFPSLTLNRRQDTIPELLDEEYTPQINEQTLITTTTNERQKQSGNAVFKEVFTIFETENT